MTGKPAKKFSAEGMTLIEILLASVILSVALVVVFKVFFVSASVMKYAEARAKADIIAEEAVAEAQKVVEEGEDIEKGIRFHDFSSDEFRVSGRIMKHPKFPDLYIYLLEIYGEAGKRTIKTDRRVLLRRR